MPNPSHSITPFRLETVPRLVALNVQASSLTRWCDLSHRCHYGGWTITAITFVSAARHENWGSTIRADVREMPERWVVEASLTCGKRFGIKRPSRLRFCSGVSERSRVMNRLKAVYRSWAIPCTGRDVYYRRHRAHGWPRSGKPACGAIGFTDQAGCRWRMKCSTSRCPLHKELFQMSEIGFINNHPFELSPTPSLSLTCLFHRRRILLQ
jgi:hypothetical protein